MSSRSSSHLGRPIFKSRFDLTTMILAKITWMRDILHSWSNLTVKNCLKQSVYILSLVWIIIIIIKQLLLLKCMSAYILLLYNYITRVGK